MINYEHTTRGVAMHHKARRSTRKQVLGEFTIREQREPRLADRFELEKLFGGDFAEDFHDDVVWESENDITVIFGCLLNFGFLLHLHGWIIGSA